MIPCYCPQCGKHKDAPKHKDDDIRIPTLSYDAVRRAFYGMLPDNQLVVIDELAMLNLRVSGNFKGYIARLEPIS